MIKKYHLILVAIILAGTFLRFFQLGQKSLWTDELATINNAINIHDVKTFLAHTRGDDLPKFYSLLQKYWMRIGASEFWMRSLSVIFGCLSIFVTFALCRLFFDTKTSLTSALLTALSPFLLLYDREIRVYSLFTFLSLLSTFFFIKSIQKNQKKYWTLYTIANIFNIYTHYYAFLTIGVQWLFLIIRNKHYRHVIKPWIIANTVLFGFFFVRISAFLSDVGYFAPWAISRERFPFVFAKEVVEFFYVFFSFSAGQTILPWNPMAFLIFISVLICFVLAIKKNLFFSNPNVYLILLIFLSIFTGLLFKISMPRYFTFLAPIYFIFVARGLWLLPKKSFTIALLLIILTGWGLGLSNYYQNKEFHIMAHVDPWREIAQFLKTNIKKNETVCGVGLGIASLRYYYDNSMPEYEGEELINKIKQLDITGTKRIWLVFAHQEEYANWLKARNLLNKNYVILIEKRWIHDPDFEKKKKFFKKSFSPDRIVAELYERR